MIALTAVSMLIASCEPVDYLPCVKPSGAAVEEFRTTDSFYGVNLSMHASVTVSKGKEHSIMIVAAPNIMEHIAVHSNGQTLYIDKNRCLRTRMDDVKIFITTPRVENLDLSGSGNIYLDEGFEGEYLQLSLSGSGKIFAESVSYQSITTNLSGSGDIKTSGVAHQQTVSISGSGNMEGYAMQSEYATIRISGSGNAKVFVTELLDGKIAGSGNIWYVGNPTVNISIAGSGAIHDVDQDFHFNNE